MSKKVSLVSNLVIAGVLLVLSLAIFTTDLTNVYTTVTAPVYNGNKNQKNVSLMITISKSDTAANVEQIINVLNEKDVDATFFVCGVWAMQNPELTKKLTLSHEIGNGAYSASNLKKMSETIQKKEISAAHETIKKITGVNMKLFSPPMSSFSKTTLKVAEGLGYTTVMGNKDLTTATQNLKNGDIVLLTLNTELLESLPTIIDSYKNQGFSLVTVSKNIT